MLDTPSVLSSYCCDCLEALYIRRSVERPFLYLAMHSPLASSFPGRRVVLLLSGFYTKGLEGGLDGVFGENRRDEDSERFVVVLSRSIRSH